MEDTNFTQTLGDGRGRGPIITDGSAPSPIAHGFRQGRMWVEKLVCRPTEVDAVVAEYFEELAPARVVGVWVDPQSSEDGEYVIITAMYADTECLAMVREKRAQRLATTEPLSSGR